MERPVSLIGLMLVLLALFGQMAFGAVVMPDDAAPVETALFDIAATICHAGAPASDQPAHHRSDDAYCPICAGVAMPAPILAAAADVPRPTLALVWRAAGLSHVRAPPARGVAGFLARGPPSPVQL